MNIEQLRAFCLSKPGVEESLPFGPDTLVFKVNGKMFLLAGLDSYPLQFNVKCDPDQALELREEHPDTILPGYHMNKKHWNTVIVNGSLSTQQLQGFIDDSYTLIKSKNKLRETP
ncbi:MAG: MmcQ/YjbR family DNA-binding protein [Bacteroidota bacterium]